MHFFDEAKRIWKEFVPRSGQAATVQGELLRAVEKLRDEGIRNGNCNWDDGFEILLLYLQERLLDRSVYSPRTIEETREILNRLSDYEYPVIEDEPFDRLGDRVVEYFRHYGSQPHTLNPELHR
jgi:hypothetical protein